MSAKSVSLALIPNPHISALPELSQQMYRRKSITRGADFPLKVSAFNPKLTRGDFVQSRGIAVRIPLVPANRNSEERREDRTRRDGSSASSKSISPLKDKVHTGKGKSATPGPRADQENVEPNAQRGKPPSTHRRAPVYQRVRHLLNTNYAVKTAPDSPASISLLLDSPSEPVLKWQNSARLAFARRAEMTNRPLIIIHFSGVLGDFFSPDHWTSPVEFFLRPGWVKGVRSLSQFLQVVLFIDLPRSRYEKVNQAIRASGLQIDAVYRRRKKQVAFLQDYSQTLYDFGLKGVSSSHVMVVSALQLEQSEIQTRKDWGLVYERSMSSHRRICTFGLPVWSNNVSLFWMVPNPRAQDGHECISFEDIATVILKFLEYHPGNLLRSFAHVREKRLFNINACVLPALECDEIPVLLQHPNIEEKPPVNVVRVMALPKGNFVERPYLLIESEEETVLHTTRGRHKSFMY